VVSEGKSQITQELAGDLGCDYERLKKFNARQGPRLTTVCLLIKEGHEIHEALIDLRNANIDLKAVSAGLTVGNFIRMLRDITGQAILQCRPGNVEFSYLSPLPYLTWRKTDGTIIGPLIERTPSIPPSLPQPASVYASSLGTVEDVPSASREGSRVVSEGYSQGQSQTPGSRGTTRHTLRQREMRNIPLSYGASGSTGYLSPSTGPPQWRNEVNHHVSSGISTPFSGQVAPLPRGLVPGMSFGEVFRYVEAEGNAALLDPLQDPTISQADQTQRSLGSVAANIHQALAFNNGGVGASVNGSVFSPGTLSLAPTIVPEAAASITRHYGQLVSQLPVANYLGLGGEFVARTPPPAESYLQIHGSATPHSRSTMSGGSNVVGSILGGTYAPGTQQENTSANSWMSGYPDARFPFRPRLGPGRRL
jgi:hypothetical protein